MKPTPDRLHQVFSLLRRRIEDRYHIPVRIVDVPGKFTGDLDGWLADFSACDRAYLEHFYKTGEKRLPEAFWRDGAPVLAPLPIPEFTPHRAKFRWDGVVI